MSYLGTKDWITEVRLGNVAGYSMLNMRGYAPEMTTAVQTLWGDVNLINTDILLTPAKVDVASTDANDTHTTGSGARTVLISGLDSSFDAQSETVSITGNTEVTSLNTYSAINSLTVLTAGASENNEGDIWCGNGTFTTGVPDDKYCWMGAEDTVSMSGLYTVPNGKKAWFYSVILMVGDTSKSVDLALHVYDGTINRRIAHFELGQGNFASNSPAAAAATAGQLLYWNGAVSATTADVSLLSAIILEDV